MLKLRMTHPLVVLFLGDLLDLVEELADAQLQLRQLLVLGQVGVVDGVLPHLDVEVDSQLGPTENILCRSKVYLWVCIFSDRVRTF